MKYWPCVGEIDKPRLTNKEAMLTAKFIRVVAVVSLLTLSVFAASGDVVTATNTDTAIRTLNVRLQSAPNDAELHHQLSKIYYHLKKWDDSISHGEKAVSLAPNKSDYWMWLGRAYGEKADSSNFLSAFGLAKKAGSSFEKAVSTDPANIAALTDLAEFQASAPSIVGGGTDKARQTAQRLATLDQAKAHWVYAKIAQHDKDYGTAERELKEAIRLSGNGQYWLNLAYLYSTLKRWNDMEYAIDQGLASKVRPVEAYYNAATDYLHVGRDLPKAANLMRKYLATAVDNDEAPLFEAHYMLGQILEKQGDRSGAAAEYRSALALASNYQPAANALKALSP
jgi:tetratricopeptide (TPR) repeat protein